MTNINEQIQDIKRFVSLGHAQGPKNCRVLLKKITMLEEENNRLRKELNEAKK
jgi:hypothetical protein